MQIKVFKASTMKEAMQQVKDELGRDAVILHTKKYREGGFLGYHSKEVVEVTAAIEDAEVKKNKKTLKVSQAVSKETAAPKAGSGLNVVIPANPVVMPTKVLSQYKTNGTETGIKLADTPIVKEPVKIAAAGTDHSAEDAEKIQKLEDELAQMKTLLAQVMSKEQPQDTVSLQEVLKKQEVSEDLLKDMAAKMPAGTTLLDSFDESARNGLIDYFSQVIKFSGGIKLNKHGVRIAALIGPTGVGKTTTLAKIAARFVLEKNVKAALITADTYRISAVEQLKTYSDIIGLPLEIVYSPDELKVAIHKHRDKDLILIDTAGRSQHNEFQMQELQDFLAVNPHIEKHLVMSATTKNRDAADILAKFAVCKPDSVIFTKTDETSSLGLIPNLLVNKDISLAFLTNGQSVPDDIVPASAKELTELLLRE